MVEGEVTERGKKHLIFRARHLVQIKGEYGPRARRGADMERKRTGYFG